MARKPGSSLPRYVQVNECSPLLRGGLRPPVQGHHGTVTKEPLGTIAGGWARREKGMRKKGGKEKKGEEVSTRSGWSSDTAGIDVG